MTERYESRASTHADDCWSWGPKHYECAVREIKALRAEVAEWKRVAAQAPQDESPADILPPPGIHTAVHYAGWLRREAHRHQEPKASVLRQAARMLDVLKAECGRLHQELIDSQAPAPDGGALREQLAKDERGEGINVVRAAMQRTTAREGEQ